MKIEEAIQKAIEGGMPKSHTWMNDSDLLLSVTFWRSLGKTMGWVNRDMRSKNSDTFEDSEYLTHWHNLITHISLGGSIESFFEQL